MARPSIQLSKDVFVGYDNPCFIVAEIGQNHQGNINTARNLIKIAKDCGADCVKFQKSCLPEKFTEAALSRPYTSPHSWGDTYKEHKQFLEFTIEQYKELQTYAQAIDIMFTASAMDPVSLDLLNSLNVPFIKIGSGDADNLLLIKKAAKLCRPLFISTGMLDLAGVQMVHQAVTEVHSQLVLLHCVSAYPTPASAVNLRVISEFQRLFSQVPVGYSGHELGTAISVSAVALGAKVIERHITLDKQLKGSDHVCSLEPGEFKRLVDDIRSVELALGSPTKRFLQCERPCHDKLGKSVVAAHHLAEGSTLTEHDVKIKVSEPMGFSCRHLHSLLGRVLNKHIAKDTPLSLSDFIP